MCPATCRVALIAGIAAFLTGTAPRSAASPWPTIDSDLPPHPNLHEGTLPNGLRYVIFPNAEPKDRVSLRLVVGVGSIHENENEMGLAHFVEHMAFRGTRTHPAGSLLAALQRLGVGLGPDTAAFTYHDHTVYHLELPDLNEATLRDGLRVFRQYAEELTFDPDLLHTERGVVLSELAARDTPAARSGRVNLSFLWPDARQAQRPVGGTGETLRNLAREQFTAFYDAWYRPERMAVIVVGEIAPAAVERILAQELGKLSARGEPRPDPTSSPARASAPDVQIFSDPGLIGVQLVFEHPMPVPRRDTRADRIERLHRALAVTMFHGRLQRLAHEPGKSFVGPSVSVHSALPGWEVLTLAAGGRIDDWRQVAADVEREHRRAMQYGFTEQELEEARRNLAAAYDQAIATAATWPSSAIAEYLVTALLTGGRFSAPEEAKREMAQPLASATLADCLRAFQRAWTTAAPHVFVAAHPSFQITRAELAAALNQSREAAVVAHTEKPEVEALRFAYDFGTPGKLVHDEDVRDLDVRLTRFENGVRFNFKRTDFSAGDVEIRVRVGEGKLSQPQHLPGLDVLANFMVTAGGVGRHTAQELTRVLAGRALSVSFAVDTDACLFSARCAPHDVALALQVVCAFLTDAAYRPEAIRDARAAFASNLVSLGNSPSWPISMHALRDLTGGDRRFGVPTYEELISRDIDQLKAWIEPQFKRGAIEMSIAGDVSWAEALAAVSVTLGALPPRDARQIDADRSIRIPDAPAAARTFHVDPALRQTAIAWYWPVPRLASLRVERRCRLLAAVLEERIRTRIRDELGAAYTTAAAFTATEGFPDLNYFVVFVEVIPRYSNQAMAIIQQEAVALIKKGVQPDDFLRAHRPFVRSRADDLRLNSYWGGTVLSRVQQDPGLLAAARERTADTAAITADDLSALAKLHLSPVKSFRFAALPTAPRTGFPYHPPASPAAQQAK